MKAKVKSTGKIIEVDNINIADFQQVNIQDSTDGFGRLMSILHEELQQLTGVKKDF